MKRSAILLVPALALCAASEVRAASMADVDVPPAAGAPGLNMGVDKGQVLRVAAMGPAFVTSKTYVSWKSGIDSKNLAKAACLAAIEQAVASNDIAALRRALLQFVVRFRLTAQEASSLFDRYLKGIDSGLSSSAGLVLDAPRGPAFSELTSMSDRSDAASESRLDSVYSGSDYHPAATGQAAAADTSVSDGASGSAPAATAAPSAPASPDSNSGSGIRGAIAKAMAAFSRGGSAASAGSTQSAAQMPAAQGSTIAQARMNAEAAPSASPSASNRWEAALADLTGAAPGGSATLHQGARKLAAAFDNNDTTGRVPLPGQTASSSAVRNSGGTHGSGTTLAGYGSEGGAMSPASFSPLEASESSPGVAPAKALALNTRLAQSSVAPVQVPTPKAQALSNDAISGIHMSYMKVPVPSGLAGGAAKAEGYAALSLLALAAGAGLKLFLGKALRPEASSPLDFNHLLD